MGNSDKRKPWSDSLSSHQEFTCPCDGLCIFSDVGEADFHSNPYSFIVYIRKVFSLNLYSCSLTSPSVSQFPFKPFIIKCICLFVFYVPHAHVCHSTWRSENCLWESGDQTQITGLGGKHPYLLRDLVGTVCYGYCLIRLLSLNLNLFSSEHWRFLFLLQAFSGYISGSSLQTPLWSCLFFWLLWLWLPLLEQEPVGIPQSLLSKCLYFCWCFMRLWPRLLTLDCQWRLFQAITMGPGAPNPPECRTMVRKCGWVDPSLFHELHGQRQEGKV